MLDCRVQVDGEEKYQEAASVVSRHCLCPDADACRVCTQKELRVASDLSSMPASLQALGPGTQGVAPGSPRRVCGEGRSDGAGREC